MADCIFCKIASGEMGTEFVAESGGLVAFNDVNPQAPVHVLVVPKEHIETTNDLAPELAGAMVSLGVEVARKLGVAEDGYRMVFNSGVDGGQEVPHVHLHLLGRRRLGWPPG